MFTINWQTWQGFFPHGSLPKMLLRIGSEALTKWTFKLFPLQNSTIRTLGNTFWYSLSGASRICNSSKIVLVFWNTGIVILNVSLFSSWWLHSFFNNSFLGIFCVFKIFCLATFSLYPRSCNQCCNLLHPWSKKALLEQILIWHRA